MMELMLSREDQRIYLQRENLVRYRHTRTLNTRQRLGCITLFQNPPNRAQSQAGLVIILDNASYVGNPPPEHITSQS